MLVIGMSSLIFPIFPKANWKGTGMESNKLDFMAMFSSSTMPENTEIFS